MLFMTHMEVKVSSFIGFAESKRELCNEEIENECFNNVCGTTLEASLGF